MENEIKHNVFFANAITNLDTMISNIAGQQARGMVLTEFTKNELKTRAIAIQFLLDTDWNNALESLKTKKIA